MIQILGRCFLVFLLATACDGSPSPAGSGGMGGVGGIGCRSEAVANVCREGYECVLFEVCEFTGCGFEDDCRPFFERGVEWCLPEERVAVCAERCQVGSGATPGDSGTYLDNTQGCRDGYRCFWLGREDDRNGACLPGEFNGVREANIGSDCRDDSECYSPFGQGVCVGDGLGLHLYGEDAFGSTSEAAFRCTVFDCAAPGIPDDVCGDDATCVPYGATSLCEEACVTAEDCRPVAACVDLDGNPRTPEMVCDPYCDPTSPDPGCRAGEVCEVNRLCVPEP